MIDDERAAMLARVREMDDGSHYSPKLAKALANEVERLAAEVVQLRDVGGRMAESLEAKRPKTGPLALRWHDEESELNEWQWLTGLHQPKEDT